MKILNKDIEDWEWWEILVIAFAFLIVFEIGKELFMKIF